MSKHRLIRFCYLSNEPHGRHRYPHQLRDGDAAIEILPALQALGFEYDGIFINWPGLPTAADTSLRDFESLGLDESDVLLLTTRPPIDDKVRDMRPLRKSRTALEDEIFEVLRQKCFRCCSRKEIGLCESASRHLAEPYRDRSVITFEVKGQEAAYKGVYGGDGKNGYVPWNEQMSAGYIVHVPLGEKRPRLLAIFGMSGTMTLLWAHRLSKLQHIIEEALMGPSLTIAEMVRTGPIPSEPDETKTVDLSFCLKWDLKVIGHCKLR